MKHLIIVIFAMFSVSSFATEELKDLISQAARSDNEFYTQLELSSDISLPATIRVSTKGNGSLSVANLRLKVYDSHGDTRIYDNSDIKINLVDLDGDNLKELLLSGIVIYTGEKGDINEIETHFVRGYKYDLATETFINILAVGNFQPDYNADDFWQ